MLVEGYVLEGVWHLKYRLIGLRPFEEESALYPKERSTAQTLS